MPEWIKGHETLVWWMTSISIISFITALVAVPWSVVQIPSNYFSQRKRTGKSWADQNPAVRALLLSVKNLLGYILIVVGIIMLAIPGQGMLTILTGIIFLDLPGKYKLEKWAVTHTAALRSINWLRKRAGKSPLVL